MTDSEQISFRQEYALLVDVEYEGSNGKFEFEIAKCPADVEIIIDLESRKAESFWAYEFPHDIVAALESGASSKLTDTESDCDFSAVRSSGANAMNRLLELIRFCLNLYEAPESLFSSRQLYCRIGENDWEPVAPRLSGILDIPDQDALSGEARGHIQELLDRNFEPLAGFRYLLRAKREDGPQFKYVDATVAAELAVKDTLCRIEPKLSKLLTAVPSPPLSKLYGAVLEHYGGEASPVKSRIAKGAEKRNSLIHNHEADEVDQQESIKYCFDVYDAIAHLLKLLPDSGAPEDFFFGHRSRVGAGADRKSSADVIVR